MVDPVASPAPEVQPHEPPERQRLVLHIGVPKSGSTYLQSVLGSHRQALREAGMVYPYVRQEGMFHAAVEMAGNPARWGLDAEQIRGTFAHHLRRGRRLGGTVVMSHEIFSAASERQVAAIGELVEDFEVELVVTARDLGRTITADWQERVKNGETHSFAQFAERLLARRGEDPASDLAFWPAQNLLALVHRWGAIVPATRMHIVTGPRRGAAAGVLWERFAEAISLTPHLLDSTAVPVSNESLGTAQIALLRHVHEALDGRIEQPWRSRVAKRWFAQSMLSRATSSRAVAPAEVIEQLMPVSRAWVDHLGAGGYQVHGDLEELMPQLPEEDVRHPDDVSEAELAAGLPEVLAEMLVSVTEVRKERAELTSRTQELEAKVRELDALVSELEARRWWQRRGRKP